MQHNLLTRLVDLNVGLAPTSAGIDMNEAHGHGRGRCWSSDPFSIELNHIGLL